MDGEEGHVFEPNADFPTGALLLAIIGCSLVAVAFTARDAAKRLHSAAYGMIPSLPLARILNDIKSCFSLVDRSVRGQVPQG